MKILRWIIGTPLVLFGLLLLARFALCRPSYSVVKTATPMVEKIADYIVEHGVPESLDEIQGLPYKLEGCRKEVTHRKQVGISYENTKEKDNASFSIIEEECYFATQSHKYKIWLWFSEHHKDKMATYGTLEVGFDKTSVLSHFEMNEKKQLIHSSPGSSFDNRFGFCRQLKQ